MNKHILAILAVFSMIVVGTVGAVSAYQGDPLIKGPNYDEEIHEQLEQAIESGDYDEWMRIREENNLPTKGKIFLTINEENFYLYQELHNAVQNGDTESAAQIREQLGLGLGKMHKYGGTGMHHGQGPNGQQLNLANADCDGECDGERKGRMGM